jgi:putative transcriptional regulator
MEEESHRGRLLIASPSIYDPNFRQAVVLLAEHSEEGAMGVVLNRPSDTQVIDAAPQLSVLADPDEPVFVGGPVQPQSLVVLAEFEDPELAALTVLDDIGFVAVGSELEDLAGATRQIRAFAGHAGWGPGQLEAELEREDWIVEPAAREDVFSEAAEGLWNELLQRKGGQFALMARMPFDPSTN